MIKNAIAELNSLQKIFKALSDSAFADEKDDRAEAYSFAAGLVSDARHNIVMQDHEDWKLEIETNKRKALEADLKANPI